VALVHPDDAEWDAWTPAEAARRLDGIDVPWRVSAGWAIDLFLGVERREHDDLELAVPASRFGEVADALCELDFHAVTAGIAEPVATDAGAALMETVHQTWGLDRADDVWRVDVFREPSDGDVWIARRDETIRLPYSEVIERTPDGIPYERPEIVLLFKAKHARVKDEADLAAVLPRLGANRRRLLAEWIERVHPGHFWLHDLSS
jgi:Aminoglycoside-2''-adenylyltransferase